MSLPSKRIKRITLPGDNNGDKTYDIVPEKLGKDGFAAELPTLTEDSRIALENNLKWVLANNMYSSESTYEVGAIVYYDGYIYECTTAVSTPEAFDYAKWSAVSLQTLISRKHPIINDSNKLWSDYVNDEGQATVHKFVTWDEKQAITHSNRAILDATTASFTTDLETKLNGIDLSAYLPRSGGTGSPLTAPVYINHADLSFISLKGGFGFRATDSSVSTGHLGQINFSKNFGGDGRQYGIQMSAVDLTNGRYNQFRVYQSGIAYQTYNTTSGATTNLFTVDTSGKATVSAGPTNDLDVATKKYVDDHHDSTKADTSSLGTAASKNTGTSAGNVPVLDSNGKLVESVIPAVAITDTYEAANQAAMLALSAQKGDICIRSDLNKSFILSATPASTLANWKELKTPTDAVLSVNGKTGAVTLGLNSATSTSTGAKQYVESVTPTAASGTKKYLHLSPGAVPTRESFTYATGAFTTAAAMNFNTGSSTDTPYVSAISGGSAVSPTSKYLHASKTNVVTGVTPGSGNLTSGTESGTGKIKYIEDVTHTEASLTGTTKFNVNAIKSVALSASTASSDGPAYVQSVSLTPATLTGTTSFNTDAIKGVSLSASTTSTDGPKYVQSISGSAPSLTGTTTFVTGYPSFDGGSGKLESYDAATNGTKKVSNGTRIPYIASITGTAAGASGTAKAGSETHTHTYTEATGVTLTAGSNTGTGKITYVESIANTAASASGTDTVASDDHTHNYDKATSITLTANAQTATGRIEYVQSVSGGDGDLTSDGNEGDDGIAYVRAASFENGVLSLETAYLHHTQNAASGTKRYLSTSLNYTSTQTDGPSDTTSVVTGVTGGTVTPTTRYLSASVDTATKNTSAPSDTTTFVTGVNGGTISPITYYLEHGHTPATLGAAGTASVSISGGSYSTTDRYMKVTTTAASKESVSINGGSIAPTTRYMKVTTQAADKEEVGVSGGSISKTVKYLTHTHTSATQSGTVGAITGLAANATSAAGDIEFVEKITGGSAVTVTTKYMKFTAPVLTTSTAYQITGVGSAPALTLDNTTSDLGVITDVSGGTASVVTKYLKIE